MPTTAVQARRRETVVPALIAAWLLVAGAPGTAAAFEAETPDPDQETTVEVERTAYWTEPAPRTAPQTLREEFPPGVVCILIPELCAEAGETVTDPVEEGLLGVQEDAEPEPVQPVPDGALPVGVMFGEPRYISGLQFATPEIPEGEEPSVVELVLEVETEPTGVESPVFQDAVDAAIGQIAEMQGDDGEPSPEPFLEVLADTAEGETEPVSELDPPGIMVCGAVEQWEEAENEHVEELPDTDNCILGGDAEPLDDEGEAWAFDITGAVTAWVDDDPEFGRENHGVLIMPAPTTPLAYGDPDYTTNFLGAFAAPEEAQLRFATMEAIDDDFGGDFADDEAVDEDFTDEDFTDDDFTDDDFADDFAEPAEPDTAEAFDPPEEDAPAEAPDVAEAPTQEQPEAAGEQEAVETGAEPETPWYVWLLLPLGAGGAWWYSRLHEVDVPIEVGGGEQGGAMSRLVERVRGG